MPPNEKLVDTRNERENNCGQRNAALTRGSRPVSWGGSRFFVFTPDLFFHMPEDRVSLPAAGRMLGMSWSRTYQLMMTGKLEGEQGDNGRYQISRASVERFLAEQAAESSAA